MNYDNQCRQDFQINKSSCVAWYLMASYLYYREAESLLSDETFDKMCLYMLNNWDTIEHRYKHLVNKESLSAGTGFDIEFNRFPEGLLRIIYQLKRGI
jgi:hypothetical protein